MDLAFVEAAHSAGAPPIPLAELFEVARMTIPIEQSLS